MLLLSVQLSHIRKQHQTAHEDVDMTAGSSRVSWFKLEATLKTITRSMDAAVLMYSCNEILYNTIIIIIEK